MDLKSKIRVIENFPKEGISFKDLTTLLLDGEAYRYAIDACMDAASDWEFDAIIGPESRGFIVGCPMAYATKKAFIPVRKKGKLPAETVKIEYDLEYGTDILEMHRDAIKPGQKVIIADDLLATGGTVAAIVKMIEELGGEVVGCVFLMELEDLCGRDKLKGQNIQSLLVY